MMMCLLQRSLLFAATFLLCFLCASALYCLRSRFECSNGEQCLPMIFRCNGYVECKDGSDEELCETGRCSSLGDHRCDDGRCIEEINVCDGDKHCWDNSDERDCPPSPVCLKNQFQCVGDKKCIQMALRCNNYSNCLDSSDEADCLTHPCLGHRCDGGLSCFPKSLVCDGWKDCKDGSDEKDCASASGCLRSQFQCSDGEQCLSMYKRCNGYVECKDGSDEELCETRRCSSLGDHRCDDGRCIEEINVCDGVKHCRDESDERDCPPSPVCLKNQFQCVGDKKCIQMAWRCNNVSNCLDSSDEADCLRRPCLGHRCDGGVKCLPESLVCDGGKDCNDGSDENDCGFEDIEATFLNEGQGVSMKVRTKAGHESTRLLPVFFSQPIITGLSYDVQRQTLYVAEAGRPAIYSVRVQSIHKRELVTDRIAYPVDIAFDWTSDNVYWLDSVKGTAEVVSVVTLLRSVIIHDLMNPVSLVLSPNSGTMFIATSGFESSISMYGMDGRNRRFLRSVQGSPLSLALHPSKSILYWSDPLEGTISYVNYTSNSPARVLRREISGLMSVTASEQEVLFTSGGIEDRIRVPGYDKGPGWKSITFGVKIPSGKSECLIENGGCDQICLTSEIGRTCACVLGKKLDEDGKSCLDEI